MPIEAIPRNMRTKTMKYSLCLVIACVLLAVNADNPVKAPKFTIDLSLPASSRFRSVCDAYRGDTTKHAIESYFAKITKKLPSLVLEAVEEMASLLDPLFGEYGQEMAYFADCLDLDLGMIVMLNFIYELRSLGGGHKNITPSGVEEMYNPKACTSIIASDKNDIAWHVRNMDWNLPNDMRNLTYHCDWVKDGSYLFSGSCFVGFTGILTGIKPGAFAVSINERNFGGNLMIDSLEALLYGSYSPTHLVRYVLSSYDSYKDAYKFLSNEKVSAPVYLIVSGADKNQGVILTRDRNHVRDAWKLENPKTWYLLETNYDHWTQPPSTDNRRKYGLEYMDKLGKNGVTSKSMYELISKWPLNNFETAYTAVMSPKEETFDLYIRFKDSQ
eukprot:TRINITY_DN7795_c0_g1_i2.p1 TRINITY_DN7795_c0_g1~~TRINITY_DN7795_c0_g1_i2.p1  ORF type:complete len:386 (+),score=75.02 TRINITY_DN7795_c0_g1_i2:165-1322(+)